MSISQLSCFVLLLTCLVAAGCSGNPGGADLGTVTGTVYVDGQPAPAGIKLQFDPVTKGVRGSTAVTDESGQYQAVYSISRNGVRLGPCVVKMEPPLFSPGQKRKYPFPEKYYEEITQVEITSGHQSLDLELTRS
ncbi:hypothetical protein AB1K70_23050 [Bremerella sp. JC770]|uniref:hypothetical protein n=1 Tax=Bremerella sp. JC770 TaxID=3232137 RepID=UPI003459A1E2